MAKSQESFDLVDLRSKVSERGDRIFFGASKFAGVLAFSFVFLIVIFLGIESADTFKSQGLAFFTGSTWNDATFVYQVYPMLVGSIICSFIGLIVAAPISIGIAYFIEFMAPVRLAKILTSVVDLLAALPSIVIAIWGAFVFAPVAAQWAQIINTYLGSVPGFANTTGIFQGSPFIAGWVLAVMMTPIITSVSREVMGSVDKELINAALALGGSNSSTMRRVVLPTSKSGILGGILLGLGRGLGETVAVLYVLNILFKVNFNVLDSFGGAVAPMIVAYFGEATEQGLSALIAAGVTIFVVTLIVNLIATSIVDRSVKKMAS